MKIMYLARRHPRFPSQEAFRPRWRQHGALAMSLPTWTTDRRYLHSDAVPGQPHDYDGVGIMWSSPVEELRPANPSPAQEETSRLLLADEMEAFDGPVLPNSVLVDETVVKPGQGTATTAYLFWNDSDAAGRAADALAALTGPAAPPRVVMNRALDRTLSETPPLHSFKGIVELSAPDEAAVRSMLAAAQVTADLTVISEDKLLWDNGPVAALAG